MDLMRQVFQVDVLERYAAKGRGVITCMSAGNDVIVLGTSKGWLIRHDFGAGDSYDIDLSAGRPGEQSIHKVFVDPGGSHCIATIVGSGGAETFYTHAKWSKPRVLSKLKGLVVNAVAWNRQQITEASTKEIILGTDTGQLHEMAVDEKDKREKYIKLLFELNELPEAFMGLQMETASLSNGTRYYVMAVTPTRLYSFTGFGSLDILEILFVFETLLLSYLNILTVFASYLDRAVHFMELPVMVVFFISELHFFIKQRRAVHFAWLSGAGIYHGGLNFGAQRSYVVKSLLTFSFANILGSSPNGDENFVENKALLSYSKLSEGAEAVKPGSMAVSEYHFLLLMGNKVKVVNRISEQIIEELQFDQTSDSISRGIIGLCSDATAGVFYAYDQNSIFQVSVNDEGRDMWKVYLDMKEYAAALANCRDPLQRDQVYLVQCISLKLMEGVLQINYILSFEEITLKFISVTEQDALRTFLLRKLDNLAKDDKCQITMISTWATELYLDKINRLLLEDDTALENRSSEYQSIIREFRAFLSDCKDVLDEATTMKLLESYGRVEELVFFASLKEQHEIVVHHYIQQGEAKKALQMLRKPAVPIDLQVQIKFRIWNIEPLGLYPSLQRTGCRFFLFCFFIVLKSPVIYLHLLPYQLADLSCLSETIILEKTITDGLPTLQYKFAPDLIMLDAYETVESWMTTNNLNPRKLIPAMMRYSSEPHAKNETHEVIKYLEFCVHRSHNEDPGVHNLLLSLYAKQEDDSALLRFLQCKFGKGRENGPEFFYDPKYALRLCLKEKRMRACVHIYGMMSMHEEAVALALQVDPELAMAEADKVEDDEDLRKKLWLMVAKHVIEQEKGTKRENIRKAIAFLKETDGLLKIEDILPFFPDFALIDDFKEAICSSLDDYNKQIEQLKQEMNDATHGADNIRNDISALAQRYAVIDRDEDCGVCRRKILIAGRDYRMARGYASVGPMAPFYVFPCGHAFHAQCLIAHVTQCTNETQVSVVDIVLSYKRLQSGWNTVASGGLHISHTKDAEYILDLQKQLTLLGSEARKDANGVTTEDSITSMTPTDKLRSQLDDAIASECPFCGDLMIREISLPFIAPEEAHQFASWEIKPQNLGNHRSLSLPV
ncbi:vacuolar sorting protein 18 [Citrus sinensis]|uniref:Vacuolar sorting protein 18 n=1 Tax=Citrus sinensis TaxID=2711 RepID=A0ACB8N4I8_CITSI|nr:vacuolar sorting protein 18 [Citrus sinensis]